LWELYVCGCSVDPTVVSFPDNTANCYYLLVINKNLRISRDTNDLNILLKWFSSHPPFLELNEIISISTGVVGDTTINCHNAYEIGLIEMKKIIGQTYGTVKLKRSNRVLPIAIVNSSIRIREEIISIDPLLIFQRISIMKTSNEELKSYFEYELSPYPLSLFN